RFRMTQTRDTERQRLEALYEKLRQKLLDLSRSNRMLNYRMSDRSKGQLRIVDEVLEDVYQHLAAKEQSLQIAPLPEPDDIPPEEKTQDFIDALAQARASNLDYLKQVEDLDPDDPSHEPQFAEAESVLREKVRLDLGTPPRPRRKDINRAEHARSLGVNPTA